MRTTAILNLKGGVGKTTTAIYMGAILSQVAKQRVLLIDADHQCNLTEFFEADPNSGTLAEMLRNQAGYRICIQNTSLEGLDIIPGSKGLMALDLSSVESKNANVVCLRDMVGDIAALDLYDYILIDCPPAFTAASAAALVAADDVIIPIKLDAFSLSGMGNILEQITNMRQINDKLRVAGCLPTMWYKSKQILEAEQILRDSHLHIYPHIRRSPKVDDMTFSREVLTFKRAGSEIDYKTFVVEYVGGIGDAR